MKRKGKVTKVTLTLDIDQCCKLYDILNTESEKRYNRSKEEKNEGIKKDLLKDVKQLNHWRWIFQSAMNRVL